MNIGMKKELIVENLAEIERMSSEEYGNYLREVLEDGKMVYYHEYVNELAANPNAMTQEKGKVLVYKSNNAVGMDSENEFDMPTDKPKQAAFTQTAFLTIVFGLVALGMILLAAYIS